MSDPAAVYLLWCGPRRALYTGWTTDVPRRLAAHQAGNGAKYTRAYAGEVELAAVIPMPDAQAARREEARIKRLSRAEKVALVARHEAGAAADPPQSMSS
jgi:putative endonuclease